MTELAREYGDGLYALTREEKISAEILEQMIGLRQLFLNEKDFIRLLNNMSLSKTERVNILDSALCGQIHPYLLNFLKILCEKGALGEFSGCLEAFSFLYQRDHGIVEAVATTAVPLNDEQREALLKKLSKMTGKQVVLSEKVDESVVGGVLLEMEGRQYDNTVRNRLKNIHQSMAHDA